MTQFMIYQNKNTASKAKIPYLLDIQNDFLSDLETRLIVPVYTQLVLQGKRLSKLMPTVEIDSQPFVLMVPELASVAKKQLGAQVLDASNHRTAILDALDLLVTGF